MEEGAVDRIARLAVEAAKANRLNTDTPAVLVNGSVVSLESLHANRSRFRGSFVTPDLREFAAYIESSQLKDQCAIFVNGELLKASAYLNIGTQEEPGHCDWRAVLDVEYSAEMKAVYNITNGKTSQRDLSDWIEDWQHILSGRASDGTELDAKQMVAAIRAVKVNSSGEVANVERDFGGSRSAFEDVEASSKAGKLPAIITANLSPAQGFGSRAISLRVSILTGEEKPRFVLRIIAKDLLDQQLAAELVELIRKELGGLESVRVGNFSP